jgi:hypothetical protein
MIRVGRTQITNGQTQNTRVISFTKVRFERTYVPIEVSHRTSSLSTLLSDSEDQTRALFSFLNRSRDLSLLHDTPQCRSILLAFTISMGALHQAQQHQTHSLFSFIPSANSIFSLEEEFYSNAIVGSLRGVGNTSLTCRNECLRVVY